MGSRRIFGLSGELPLPCLWAVHALLLLVGEAQALGKEQ
jgi:hypothetical protein